MDKYTYIGNKHISLKKRKKLADIFKNLTALMKNIEKETGNNQTVKKQILEEKLLEVIKTYPELMFMLHYDSGDLDCFSRLKSFAYYCLNYQYLKLFDEICNNIDVCTMTMWDDYSTIEYLGLMDRWPQLFKILWGIL